MSVKALAWACEQQTGDPMAKLVLVALADFSNPLMESFPGRKTLARYSECSIDTIDRKLAHLVDKGFIIKESRASRAGDKTSNLYTLLTEGPHTAATLAAPERLPQPHTAATPPAGCGHHGEPSDNQSSEPLPEVPAVADVVEAERGSDHANLIEWWCTDYHRRFHAPYKVTGGRDGKAVKLLLKHFKTIDATQVFITACHNRGAEFPFKGMTGTIHRFAENISTFQAALVTPRKQNSHNREPVRGTPIPANELPPIT